MAEQHFGVKKLRLTGGGTPSLTSQNDLQLNADTVAISTNATVGGGINAVGVVTAASFSGSGAGLTALPAAQLTGSLPAIDGSALTGVGAAYTNSDVDAHLNTSSASSGEILSWNGSDYDWVADQTGGGSVPENLTATTLNVSGITTSGSFVTDLITADGTGRGFCTRYYVTANGASAYRFAGPGQRNSVDNPTLYLMRGFTYMFENSTGSSHPFRIQFTGTTTGVGTYVSGDQNGIQIFTIPHDAPASYEYQCTAHSGMKGTFVIPS